jgi:hypothetical protein
MGRRLRFATILGLSTLVLALLVVIIATRDQGREPLMPVPNGIDDLQRASKALKGNYDELNKIGTNELRALVEGDAETLKTARIGLNRKCRVSLPPYSSGFGEYMGPIGQLRHLAQAFVAEGKLAELSGQTETAADSYVDVMLLGQQISQGGIMIHQMVGISIEMMGSTRFQKVLERLNAATCHRLAEKLEVMENEREPVEEILRTEHRWCRHALGFREQIATLINIAQNRRMEQQHIARVRTVMIKSRELEVALASRAYELENGRRPAKVEDLVPNYIKAVPLDPVTGTNMAYLP